MPLLERFTPAFELRSMRIVSFVLACAIAAAFAFAVARMESQAMRASRVAHLQKVLRQPAPVADGGPAAVVRPSAAARKGQQMAQEREHEHDKEKSGGIAGAGAAGGAIAGATFGSVAGPIGTAAGAVGGAVIGGIAAGVAAHGSDATPDGDKELPQTRGAAAPRDPLAAGKPREAGNRASDSAGD